jgi:branched-chain amino acid transport system ATP-binding protein
MFTWEIRPMLQLTSINTYYGESHILRDVDLELKKGRVLALLGRNGAGKTTTQRTIMGLTAARRGTVTFLEQEITKRPTHEIAARGIGFIPAGRRLFGDLTVRQNLELGATGIKQSKNPEWTFARVFEVFPKLADMATREARFLSGGEQQMLKFGRCLLSNPQLLLLDEPSEGLAPAVVNLVMETIGMLRASGMSMLLCEQNARLALSIADDACIMEKGVIKFAGEAEQLRQQPDLHAHLGF